MGLLTVNLTNGISELQPATKKVLASNQRKGVSFPKYFTQKLEPGKTPYDEIAWELAPSIPAPQPEECVRLKE